jgi:hypothetical protein
MWIVDTRKLIDKVVWGENWVNYYDNKQMKICSTLSALFLNPINDKRFKKVYEWLDNSTKKYADELILIIQ